MGDEDLRAEIASLSQRVQRLEAAEAVRSTFAEYTHHLDGGQVDDLLDLFTEDVRFLAVDYPPGTGGTLEKRGRQGVAEVYGGLRFGSFRHHTSNTSISVADDASSAELSSYFATASPFAWGGGLYQGTLVRDPDRWRIREWQVTSTWGWRVRTDDRPYLDQPLAGVAPHALRGGRPVRWS